MTHVAEQAVVTERVLVTGWASFVDGEATAGDVLGMAAVRQELERAGLPCDTALSPVMHQGGVRLEEADPARYTHLVFACGPLHGPQIAGLHRRYRQCRRVAVGVSVIDPADPAARGFDEILPRDGDGIPPAGDLAVHRRPRRVPAAGVILVGRQAEYRTRGRHGEIADAVIGWLRDWEGALVPLDTRMDQADWRLCENPAQFEAIIRRLDLVVTMRLHGLVLALLNGVPALAVDPVAGGAKVSAQALAWTWPAVVQAGRDGKLDREGLSYWRQWCLSPAGIAAAARAAHSPPASPLSRLRKAAIRAC